MYIKNVHENVLMNPYDKDSNLDKKQTLIEPHNCLPSSPHLILSTTTTTTSTTSKHYTSRQSSAAGKKSPNSEKFNF